MRVGLARWAAATAVSPTAVGTILLRGENERV